MTDQIRTFRDAVAVVTGGGSGIGAALSRALAARGARIVVSDRDLDTAGETARAIEASGGRAEGVDTDVRDADAVTRMIDGVFARHGRVDYLFNNAGIGIGGEVLENTLDDWRYIVEVNLMGVIHGIQAAYPRMVRQGFGHIVSTASMAGLMPTPFTASYGTTKAAVVALSRALRVEAAEYGVRVSVLCPGVIRTPILTGGRHGRLKVELPAEKALENWERLRPMEPTRFAEQVLDRVADNREVIIVPSWWKLVWWLNRLSIGVTYRFSTRAYRDMKKQIGEAKSLDDHRSTTSG
jgi:NAD(P)-dependent dehydrogenase (short-subunit alcohol dehydrogenase family)